MLKLTTNTPKTSAALPGLESFAPQRIDRIKDDLLHRRRAARRLLIDARREKNALEHILTLPDAGESLHFIIDGRFEPCDLIPATRRLAHPARIKRLEITTLGFNADNIACLTAGMDQGKIENVLLVCSHYFQKADASLFALMQQEITKRGGKVYGLRTHTKLILMEMTDGRHFTIEGSGNLRACRSIEQFVFTNDRDLLLFHRHWLNDYINTTNKPSGPLAPVFGGEG